MENRFGFKDLVLSVLLLAVLVSIWLAMRQYDRQLEVLQHINSQLRQQTQDLAQLRMLWSSGAVASPETGAGANASEQDPFARIRQAQSQPDFALGDYYVDVFPVVPDKLTPMISTDAYATIVQSYVLETLGARDPDTLEWSPRLATGWQIEDHSPQWNQYVDQQAAAGIEREMLVRAIRPADNDEQWKSFAQGLIEQGVSGEKIDALRKAAQGAPDAIVIRFDLRPGVVFSNGRPLTADDVVFSYQWMMNEQVEAPRARAYYEKIHRVEKVSDHQVIFAFKEPYFQSFELAAGMDILSRDFYSRWTPSEFNRSTGLLLGCGPYRLADPESWRPEPGKPIELIRNERYWGPPAPFDKLIWKVIENDTARLTEFRNGGTDAFYAQPEQYEQLRKNEALLSRTQHFEYQNPAAGYMFVAWNQQRNGAPTRFAERRVRQAMTLLTDRQRIIDEMYLGYGQVVSGPFSPLTPQSDQAVESWPFDPERAKALLAEVGYRPSDREGLLVDSQGRPFSFKLSYPANSETFNRVVLFLKDTFARAGVVVEPEPLEWSVLLKRIDDRDFEAVSLGWTGNIESDPYQIFHSSQIGGTGDNNISYRNPRLDELIEQARSSVIEEQRMPLWHQAHRILHEDQPYTFLFTRKSLVFLDGRLRNVQRVKLGLNPILEWYVPKEQWRWVKPGE